MPREFRKLAMSMSWRAIVSYFFLLVIFYEVMDFLIGNRVHALVAVILSVPFAIVLSWIITKRMLKPLAEISKAAREMTGGDLEREIKVYSQDEIGDLAKNINLLGSKLRNTINEITAEKDLMHAVLNSMHDGVVAVDGDGCVLMINPVVARVLNISGEYPEGKDVVGLIRHPEFERNLKVALETQEESTIEVQVLTPDPKFYRVVFTPLKGTGRGGVVAVFRDITERRQLELIRAEFIANVSHELRTPLTSMKGFVEALLDGALEDRETAVRFLRIINDETERMNRLIGDLFSLSEIESRRVVPAREELQMKEIIEKVFDILSHAAGEKEINLVSNIGDDFPVITGDGDMLTRVFINLVDNAVKYSNGPGEINVSGGSYGGEVFISVTDRGIGIPEESLPRIFERLYRVDKARSRKYGGSGLGLAIVKHIVEIHGGRIEVDSKVGAGSKFTVYLPV
ncbi:MAG: two-component system histidine kinase PnpS [Bacillota bacterium]